MYGEIQIVLPVIDGPGLRHQLPAIGRPGGAENSPFQQRLPWNHFIHPPGVFEKGQLPAGKILPT